MCRGSEISDGVLIKFDKRSLGPLIHGCEFERDKRLKQTGGFLCPNIDRSRISAPYNHRGVSDLMSNL